jgi:site-specific recombinase XerD
VNFPTSTISTNLSFIFRFSFTLFFYIFLPFLITNYKSDLKMGEIHSKSDIDILISDIEQYQRQIRRSDSTISHNRQQWRKVKLFMEKSGLTVYDKTVETSFLHSVLGDYDYKKLLQRDKTLVNVVRQLLSFQETKVISAGYTKKSPDDKFPFAGELGRFIKGYIERNIEEKGLANSTANAHYYYLNRLNAFLVEKKINVLDELTPAIIQEYVGGLSPHQMASKYAEVKHIKQFLADMYRQGKTKNDLSLFIESVNYRNQAKLPSTLSAEETRRLLLSVDRANSKGKRDYAILLLAVHLGLRRSDIVGMRFENIDWEKSIITLQQQKTGKTVELPLLADVGNAIIDYLKYGRPQSEETHIFLQLLSPYKNMKCSDIGNILQPYLTRAEINIQNRKHGPNILRHSLAGRLLNCGTQLPVISETLGHASSQTTMFYLRIDAARLRECALDVPEVPCVFYQRKGGIK